MNKVLLVLILGLVACQSTREIKNSYPDSCLEQENNCGYVFENYPQDRIVDIKRMKETIQKDSDKWESF